VDAGHSWVGLDISRSMLDVAVGREVEGDALLGDVGQGFGFRAGTFDGAISVSALQWLCYSDKKDHRASRRLTAFFSSLYRCLRRGARAALQVYPENSEQLESMTTAALRCGFTGGLVVDFPNSTKAKKYYLCLFAGVDPDAARAAMPAGRDGRPTERSGGGEHGTAAYEARRGEAGAHRRGGKKARGERLPVKSRGWILKKKESRRQRGEEVRPDSRYTGRKRSGFRV
jgi:18S rRNA (guanine1575-N7)-methyltransferase